MEKFRKANQNQVKQKSSKRVDVIDKVEIQNPYIRQFGRKTFDLQSYLDEILSKNDTQMIRQAYQDLKKSNSSLQKEIGNYLFESYKSFLTSSEKLENIKHDMEDVKTILSQYSLVISSIKGQMERFDQAEKEWAILAQENKSSNPDLFDKEGVVHECQEILEVVENYISLSKYEEATKKIDEINNLLEELEWEQQLEFRQKTDQLKNVLDSAISKSIMQDLDVSIKNGNISNTIQAYLGYQSKLLLTKLRKLDPLSFHDQSQAHQTKQYERLQQLVYIYIDFISKVIKDFDVKFKGYNIAEILFSQWLRDVTETVFATHLAIYLKNPFIQNKIGDSLKLIIKLVQELQKTNLNLLTILERCLAPIVIDSLEMMLQQKLLFDDKEKGLRKHVQQSQSSMEWSFIDQQLDMRNLYEMEEQKLDPVLYQGLCFLATRRQFFKKLIRFFIQHHVNLLDFTNYPFISVQVANYMTFKVTLKFTAIEEEDYSQLDIAKILITEYSSQCLISILSDYYYQLDFHLLDINKIKLKETVDDVYNFFHQRFSRALQKDFILKLAQVVVKQKNFEQNFFQEEPIDYNQIVPVHIFKSLSRFLQDTILKIHNIFGIQPETYLQESQEFFKEQLMLVIVSKALEIVSDILLKKESELQTQYSEYFSYIQKLLSKQFTARFVGNSGTQNLMFGVWYLCLSITVLIKNPKVRSGQNGLKVKEQLDKLTLDIQNARKDIMDDEEFHKIEINEDIFKSRIKEALTAKN